ncbi:hypothetical protein [Hymenobacter siberiensis]
MARLRRKLSAARVAERAAISRPTLLAIEKGSARVNMGPMCRSSLCWG